MASAENSSLEYLRSLGNLFEKKHFIVEIIYLFIVNYDIDSILYDDTLICSLTNNTDVGSFEVKLSKANYGELHDCIQVIANRFDQVIDINNKIISFSISVKQKLMMFYVEQRYELW